MNSQRMRYMLRILIAHTGGKLLFEEQPLAQEWARIIWDGAGMRTRGEKRQFIKEVLNI